jgi:hypothetical protein
MFTRGLYKLLCYSYYTFIILLPSFFFFKHYGNYTCTVYNTNTATLIIIIIMS